MKDDKRSAAPAALAKAGTEQPAGRAGERDFAAEIEELKREFPEVSQLEQLPDEVVEAVVREGKSVLEAYRDYVFARAAEKPVKKTGAGSAKRAPVRGVSGGWPVEDQVKDAFMNGFDDEA